MRYGIDIGTSSFKAAAVRRSLNGFRLIGATRRRLPQTDRAEERAAAVVGALREIGGGAKAPAGIVGISGREINLQVVMQPNTTPLNYRTLMRYELEQRQGEGLEYYGDWCTLREADAYFPQYLSMVALGKRACVDAQLDALKAGGFTPHDVVPTPFALFAAYHHAYGAEPGVVLLLDIGSDNMDLAMVRGGWLLYARNVSAGARVFDNAIKDMGGISAEDGEARKIQFGNLGAGVEDADAREEEVRAAVRSAAGQIVGVIQSTIQFAKNQLADRELTVDKIYLSGGGARLRGFPEYLASALKIPVEALDPFRKITGSPAGLPEDFRQAPSDMAVAVGLAILATGADRGIAQISLAPSEVRKRRDFVRGPAILMAAGAVLAAAMLLATVIAMVGKGSGSSELDGFRGRTAAVSRKIEELDAIEERMRESVRRADLLASRAAAARGTLDAMTRLRKTLPEGVVIRKIEWVDLADRPHDPVPRTRCVFNAAGRGLTVGRVVRDEGEKVVLSGEGEAVKADLVGYRTWPAPAKGLQIEGEIDENIRGGAGPALDAIKEQLSDPSRGIAAQIPFQDAARDKPDWRVFRILLRYE